MEENGKVRGIRGEIGGGESTGRVSKMIGMGKIGEARGGAWQRTEEDGGGEGGRSCRRGRWR